MAKPLRHLRLDASASSRKESTDPREGEAAFDVPDALLERLRARDDLAYAELFRIAYGPLAEFAYGYLRSREAAEDIVQDVLCGVWQLGASWQPRGSARAYFYRAVRNRAINALRHERTAADHEASVRASVEREPELAAVLVPETDEALADILRREIAGLTERQRAAFALRFARGLSNREVAEVLGVTMTNAEKLFARAFAALRHRLRHLRGG